MKKDDHLPGLPTMAALALCAILTSWLGLFGPIDTTAIKQWQTLLSAIVAAVGVAVAAYVAVRNVNRQIRLGALGREEDRIERELPGLYDAHQFCGDFLFLRFGRRIETVLIEFESLGFGIAGSTYEKDVRNALETTDINTRLLVANSLGSCLRWAQIARLAETAVKLNKARATASLPEKYPFDRSWATHQVTENTKQFAAAMLNFQLAMDSLERLMFKIMDKIEAHEAKLRHIRKDVDAYFDDM